MASNSEDEEENLAHFLESEVLSQDSDQETELVREEEGGGVRKKQRVQKVEEEEGVQGFTNFRSGGTGRENLRSTDRGSNSEDEEENLAHFLESEVLSQDSDQETELVREEEEGGGVRKKQRVQKVEEEEGVQGFTNFRSGGTGRENMRSTYRGFITRIPPELFRHILKFLSSEDLVACSLVCRLLNFVASDECLWRRLYCMRWGLLPPTKKLRDCAWKKLYIQRDEHDMIAFARNCPIEFKEYYIQMQVAKRSQAPLPSQVKDDWMILDKSVADQVSIWKRSKGLTDELLADHYCSGRTCSYYQIGDVYVCENTGVVHVCDDTCKEVVLDPTNGLLVCTVSGHCFDQLLSQSEIEAETDQQQGGASDELEPFMGSGRFARAYQLGYNCHDEEELEACLRLC